MMINFAHFLTGILHGLWKFNRVLFLKIMLCCFSYSDTHRFGKVNHSFCCLGRYFQRKEIWVAFLIYFLSKSVLLNMPLLTRCLLNNAFSPQRKFQMSTFGSKPPLQEDAFCWRVYLSDQVILHSFDHTGLIFSTMQLFLLLDQ